MATTSSKARTSKDSKIKFLKAKMDLLLPEGDFKLQYIKASEHPLKGFARGDWKISKDEIYSIVIDIDNVDIDSPWLDDHAALYVTKLLRYREEVKNNGAKNG